MAKKKTTRTKRTAAKVRGVAKRATGMGRAGKPNRRRTARRRGVKNMRALGTRKMTRRSGRGGGRGKDTDMVTTATRTLRKAADTAMGIASTAIARVRPR